MVNLQFVRSFAIAVGFGWMGYIDSGVIGAVVVFCLAAFFLTVFWIKESMQKSSGSWGSYDGDFDGDGD